MNNRPLSSPILLVMVLSLILHPAYSNAEPGVPSDPPASTNSVPLPTPAPVAPPDVATTGQPSTYTVASGDSLWLIAHKFHCSVNALKKLNNLKKNNLKPGQTLQIPPVKSETPAVVTPAPKTTSLKPHSVSPLQPVSHQAEPVATMYRRAQPVQDFDIPASTFASCPTPPSTSDAGAATPASAAPEPAPMMAETPPPRALPVAAADLDQTASATGEPAIRMDTRDSSFSSKHSPEATRGDSISVAKIDPKPVANQSDSLFTASSSDWGNRFLREARDLGNRGIEYDESWQPPGESHSWDMDCSNTSRYIYKVTTGIDLPRTASDQYYYLHLQNKAWDVPQTQTGFADCTYLRQNLKPGDLLFWENTYKPERQPPITHVMVFLGTNDKGQWIMAGSQTSRGGEHNRSHGGPDIYVFDPTKPCGGYSTWMGLVHHQGRFCAFGRPLEADKSKLAVAAND